jgi:hypothetical protein
MASSSTNISSTAPTTAPAPAAPANKRQVDIIDLTLDSSDEEDTTPAYAPPVPVKTSTASHQRLAPASRSNLLNKAAAQTRASSLRTLRSGSNSMRQQVQKRICLKNICLVAETGNETSDSESDQDDDDESDSSGSDCSYSPGMSESIICLQ